MKLILPPKKADTLQHYQSLLAKTKAHQTLVSKGVDPKQAVQSVNTNIK